MVNILFICYGNICRSTMAEFFMKDLVEKRGLEKHFHIASAATSNEEIGNGRTDTNRRKRNLINKVADYQCVDRIIQVLKQLTQYYRNGKLNQKQQYISFCKVYIFPHCPILSAKWKQKSNVNGQTRPHCS